MQGFYEWKRAGKTQQSYFIHRRDGQPMNLAAVLGARHVHGEIEPCVSIATSAANAFMESLHDRMPIILEDADVGPWLHPQSTGHEGVIDFAVPAGEVLECYPVSTEVNSRQNHGWALDEIKAPNVVARDPAFNGDRVVFEESFRWAADHDRIVTNARGRVWWVGTIAE